MRSVACVSVLVLLVACGGGGSPGSPSSGSSGSSGGGGSSGSGSGGSSAGNSASGTVHGTTAQVVSATASYGPVTWGLVPGLEIELWSTQATCGALTGTTYTMFAVEMPGSPLAAGTYTVVSDAPSAPTATQGQATVEYDVTTTCVGGNVDHASGGTLTVTESDAAHVAGTFDVTFADGHVTGTFDAPTCEVDAGLQSDCPGG